LSFEYTLIYEESKLISKGIYDFLYDEAERLYGFVKLNDNLTCNEYYYVRGIIGNILIIFILALWNIML